MDGHEVCVCGHVWDEHNPKTSSCEVKECPCAGFEEEEPE